MRKLWTPWTWNISWARYYLLNDGTQGPASLDEHHSNKPLSQSQSTQQIGHGLVHQWAMPTSSPVKWKKEKKTNQKLSFLEAHMEESPTSTSLQRSQSINKKNNAMGENIQATNTPNLYTLTTHNKICREPLTAYKILEDIHVHTFLPDITHTILLQVNEALPLQHKEQIASDEYKKNKKHRLLKKYTPGV